MFTLRLMIGPLTHETQSNDLFTLRINSCYFEIFNIGLIVEVHLSEGAPKESSLVNSEQVMFTHTIFPFVILKVHAHNIPFCAFVILKVQ